MRRCYSCHETKLESEFNRKRHGLQRACRECSNRCSRRYYAANREKHKAVVTQRNRRTREQNNRLLHEYLRGLCCVRCGFSDIRALQFDHVVGMKRSSVSVLVNRGTSWRTVVAEIAKCRVLCANCHSIRTAEQFNYRRHRFVLAMKHEPLGHSTTETPSAVETGGTSESEVWKQWEPWVCGSLHQPSYDVHNQLKPQPEPPCALQFSFVAPL